MDKIIIEDGLSLKQQRGVGQYTMRLYEILSVDFAVSMTRKIFLENIKNSTVRRILYCLWLNTFFVFSLIFQKKNSICFFTSTMTPLIKLPHIKYISVIHDIRSVIHPELSTKIQNIHANFVNWTAIKFSDTLITVSNTVKEEIVKYYKIDKDKIKIVSNTSSIQNVNYDVTEKILKTCNVTSNNYLFFIGGLDKNKNVQLILDLFNEIQEDFPNLKLIIAGNKGNDKLTSQNSNIIFTGFISNEDIKVLYKNALIYLFPSIYEGFGIPILDAQTMGVPVICSDIPIFREVAGDSAFFCEPNCETFSKAISELIKNDSLRNVLKTNGNMNIKRYSIEKIKEQIKEVL